MAKTNSLIRIALLGAESTGKTQLCGALAQVLRERGQTVHLVQEYLRTWCDDQRRTPQAHEQESIALTQAHAVLQHKMGTVIADTTPLMTAVYSDRIFQDTSLYEMAFEHQRLYDMTLVTGLDLPWVADGLQRDGAHVREPVDALLRTALQRAGVPYKVIYGQGPERLNNALLALGWEVTGSAATPLLPKPLDSTLSQAQNVRAQAQFALNRGRTVWSCDKCSDAQCEHRLFTDLIQHNQ